MRRGLRALRGRFGMTARQVHVRPEMPWQWRVLLVLSVLACGYMLGYWQFAGRHTSAPGRDAVENLETVQVMQARIVHLESQLQVSNAAQGNLAKEMAAMQDEGMRLKEDVAFYKSILTEGSAAGVLKIHSIKLGKGSRAGDYQYQILLVQTGRHDKVVQGTLRLVLNGMLDGKPLAQRVEPAGQQNGIKVNFKYFQRINGMFSVPARAGAKSLQVQYVTQGGRAPMLSQAINLPN